MLLFDQPMNSITARSGTSKSSKHVAAVSGVVHPDHQHDHDDGPAV
jgi:hypothetical protein